jgi:F-type H+-transporting ATPase subunit gamma
MAGLKEIRTRKKSIYATKKITSAMKMIAAARLKRAQEHAQAARPYASLMAIMLQDLIKQSDHLQDSLPLLYGTGKQDTHLLISVTSDRGLCGGFNASIAKQTRQLIAQELTIGRQVKLICVGRKGYEQLKREYGHLVHEVRSMGTAPRFREAARLSKTIIDLLEAQAFDICTIIYNKFISALSHEVTSHRLVPFTALASDSDYVKNVQKNLKPETFLSARSLYEYEPSQNRVLAELLPKNLSVQIFRAFLETAASEQAARMTAMDSATRNAEEIMHGLELQYNRTRQAQITRELIEIISGAEAL